MLVPAFLLRLLRTLIGIEQSAETVAHVARDISEDLTPEPEHVRFVDIERQRQQERSAIAHKVVAPLPPPPPRKR
jgi:hypothetical protein